MVISRIDEENHLSKLKNKVIEVFGVIRLAVHAYWEYLLAENPHIWETVAERPEFSRIISHDSPSMKRPNSKTSTAEVPSVLKVTSENPMLSETDRSFGANEKFARLLFFDLPLEGETGTLNYLGAACIRECFDIELTAG